MRMRMRKRERKRCNGIYMSTLVGCWGKNLNLEKVKIIN